MLRRLPTSRLLALCGLVSVLAIAGAAIAAGAFGGGGPVPKRESLPVAVHQALTATAPAGMTADIQFTNRLIDSSGLHGASPVITGAKGRLWMSGDHLRIELKGGGEGQAGDTEVLLSGRQFSIYDVASHTVYRGSLPAASGTHAARGAKTGKGRRGATSGAAAKADSGPPSLSAIRTEIGQLSQHLVLSRAQPGSLDSRPQYTVRVSPRHDGGLLGAVELGWDAVRGTPLHFAVYAQGATTPVLALTATNVHYGQVPASDYSLPLPSGVKAVQVSHAAPKKGAAGASSHHKVTGLAAVRAALPFSLAAPSSLDGLPQRNVELLDWAGSPAALVTYGKGLGGIAVIEQRPDPKAPAAPSLGGLGGKSHDSQLPTVQIKGGATGTELSTPLGTLLRFDRAGVRYTLIGSITASTAQIAAGEL